MDVSTVAVSTVEEKDGDMDGLSLAADADGISPDPDEGPVVNTVVDTCSLEGVPVVVVGGTVRL